MIRRKSQRGFTLVELMIVVAIVGVLAALAIWGVNKYLASAKTTEARDSIGRIAKDASSAYNREKMAGTVLTPGTSAAKSNALCGSSSKVPGTVPAGEKYQSAVTDWDVGDNATGWPCLKFTMQDPQNYQYEYVATDVLNPTGAKFSAFARGDVDGDGTQSTFELKGETNSGVVNIAPAITEDKADE